MYARRIFIGFLTLICACTPFSSLAATRLPTAEELISFFPVPEVALTVDPSLDPAIRLVNRESVLPSSFRPKVVTPHVKTKPHATIDLQREAANALEMMFEAAQRDGLTLVAVSGYRSYSKQKTLYSRSVEKNGQARADQMCARPGASEHQLGLAMDLSCASLNNELTSKFAKKPEGQWVESHCAEYGFIIRYRKDWAKTTGYQGEPWHVRYVGTEHAAYVYKLNIPFETYVAYLQLLWAQAHPD